MKIFLDYKWIHTLDSNWLQYECYKCGFYQSVIFLTMSGAHCWKSPLQPLCSGRSVLATLRMKSSLLLWDVLCIFTSWARSLILSCKTKCIFLNWGSECCLYLFTGFANIGVRRSLQGSVRGDMGTKGARTLGGHQLLLREFFEKMTDLLCCWGVCFPGVHGASWSACAFVWF